MKNVLSLMIMTLIVSCGAKNKSQDDYGGIILGHSNIDSDFDGTNDAIELKRGTSPFIANYPKLNFKASSLDFSGELKYEIDGKEKFKRLKHKIGKIEYENYYNSKNENLNLTLDYLESSEVKCLNQFKQGTQKRLTANKLKMFYSIYPTDFENVDEISNIQGMIDKKINFYFKTVYKNKNDFKKKSELNLEINLGEDYTSNDCIDISDLNYSYKISGKELQLSKIRKEIESKLAHIIVLTKEKSIVVSVNPEKFTIDTLLKHLKLSPIFSSEKELISLQGITNDFHQNLDIQLKSKKQLKLGRWFFNSSNNSKIGAPFETGVFYSLSYLTINDLLTHAKTKNEIQLYTIFGEKRFDQIENLRVGDRVEIRMNYSEEDNLRAVESYQKPGFFYLGFNSLSIINHPIESACTVYKDISYDRKLYQKLKEYIPSINDFKLKLLNRDIIPIKEKNNLIYVFQLQQTDFKDGILEINLASQFPQSFEYNRITEEKDISEKLRCKYGNEVTNSRSVNKLTLARQLRYSGTIKVFGPIR
jgi:hypothetical protein